LRLNIAFCNFFSCLQIVFLIIMDCLGVSRNFSPCSSNVLLILSSSFKSRLLFYWLHDFARVVLSSLLFEFHIQYSVYQLLFLFDIFVIAFYHFYRLD
jgi:hypothetical protein